MYVIVLAVAYWSTTSVQCYLPTKAYAYISSIYNYKQELNNFEV